MIMQARQVIEQLIIKEVKGLCSGCSNSGACIYEKVAIKQVIQCELFELDADPQPSATAKGLCKSCDNASVCKLPGRNDGVWHCYEFI
jgi:hypothetical protein